jgi:hypothetical protein
MVNVASLMKNAKQEEQNKDTPSVTEQNKAIAPAPVEQNDIPSIPNVPAEQNDIPSIPNVPADAKATTATSDGKVDIGTDKVKDASADVTATPVDYKYDKATGGFRMNTGNDAGYYNSDSSVADSLNLMADAMENGDYDTVKSVYRFAPKAAQDMFSMLTGLDSNRIIDNSVHRLGVDITGDTGLIFPSKDKLKSEAPTALISALRTAAGSIQADIKAKAAPAPVKPIPPAADKAKATPAPVKPSAPVADKAKAEVKAPVATATPDIKPTPATTPSTDKATTPATPTTDAATPAAPVETPEERHQKIVEYTKNFLDSNILEGKKPEDINWTDKKVTGNITTNYNTLNDENKAEAEKQLMKLATGNPEAEAAVKDAIINAKSSKWDKFWRDAGKWVVDKAHWLYDNRLSSNKQTFNEWINDNPSVLTAVFGNSGLNFGERLGNAVGLAAAMTSDIFKGVYEGANNMANSGPTSTKAFIEPYKSIAAKNIEQIVKNKEGTTEATAEQAKAAQKLKGLKVAKYFSNDDVTNMQAVAANPKGDLSKIYADDTMWKPAYAKAKNVKEEDIDTKYAANFLNWKQSAWNDITNALEVGEDRLNNTKALQNIESQNISIANQVHELGVNRFKDWNDIELGLLKQKQDLIQLRNKAAVADKAQLIELAKSYKDLMTGMSSTSSTAGTSTAGTSTKSSSNTVGGNVSVKVKGVGSAGGEAKHTGSSTNAETNANNNTLTVTSDANTDAVIDFANDPKLIKDLATAKKQYTDSIDSMIRYIDLALNQAKSLREAEAASSSVTSSDARLKNLIDTGHYVAGSDYYRALLSVI